MTQLHAMNLNIQHILTPSGSAGTHAGLLAGFEGTNCNIPITGISVNRKKYSGRNCL